MQEEGRPCSRPFLFLDGVALRAELAGGRHIAAEETELAGGVADFRKGLVEAGDIARFQINKKLVFPGAAVNRAAFDLEEIDAVFGERFKSGEERSGPVGEAQGEGDFACLRREPRRSLVIRDQENKASEVFRVVLDARGKNHAVVMLGGAPASNGRAGVVSAGEHFANAAGRIFRGNALQLRMSGEEAFALRKSHGMRGHGSNARERGTGDTDEMVLDEKDGFRDDGEPALQQEVVDAHDGAGEGVFHGSKQGVGGAFADSLEGGIKRDAGHGGDGAAEQLNRGSFAEGSGLTLKGDAHGLPI